MPPRDHPVENTPKDPSVTESIELTYQQHRALQAQATNYHVILRFLQASGINGFLAERKLPELNLMDAPDDITGGDSVCLFLKSIADECNRMDQKITDLSAALVNTNIMLVHEKRKNAPKPSLFTWLKDFIFEKQ